MAKVKYHFALNDKGQIIDIADVTEETKHDKYYCLNCGDAWDLASAVRTPITLPIYQPHRTAIRKHIYTNLQSTKIKEKFDSSATFEISLHQVSKCLDKAICPFYKEEQCQSTDYKTYDLHKNYDTCVEEQVIDNYQADLLLTSSIKPNTPPILIEIYVSHKCEEAKIESGLRIIEIKIRNEEDIVKLLQSPITEYEEYSFDKNEIKCTFFNFNKSASDEKLEMRDIPKFYLFRSGYMFPIWKNIHLAERSQKRQQKCSAWTWHRLILSWESIYIWTWLCKGDIFRLWRQELLTMQIQKRSIWQLYGSP